MEQRSAHPTEHEPYGLYEPHGHDVPYDAYGPEAYDRYDGRYDGYGDGPRRAYDQAPAAPAPEDAVPLGAPRGGRVRRRPRLPRPAAPAAGRTAPPRPAPGDELSEPAPAAAPSGRPGGDTRSRLPAPRLTGLGVGVFSSLLMAAAGGLSGLLPFGAPVLYGCVFVLACVAGALWVRPAELFAAPVAAPLAYTVGQFFTGGPGSGLSGLLQDVFTGLALHALWLYAGTLCCLVLVLVRRVLIALRHRREQRRQPAAA